MVSYATTSKESKREEEFNAIRANFEASIQSNLYQEWLHSAIQAWEFYEGNQWEEEDRKKLKDAGLKTVTINMLSNPIDTVTGQEIRNRTKFKFLSRTGKPQEVATAETLSDLSMFVQNKNRSSRILSEAKHHARVCGLGWHSFDIDDGTVKEALENELEVVWDVRDRTDDLSNQGFVARMIWMTLDDAKIRFPDKKDDLESASVSVMGDLGAFGFASQYQNVESRSRLLGQGGYFDKGSKEVAVVEYQYRKPAKYYTYGTDDGLLISTFDKAEAEKNAAEKNNIEVEDGYKVCFCYFAGSILLDLFDYEYQIDPSKGHFTLTPFVRQRSVVTGRPMGLVEKAIDAQRLFNTKQAKINWLMAARTVIADKSAVDDPNRLKAEVAKPNAFIIKNPGKELIIDDHSREIAQHYQALALHKQEIQDALGIYDETLGAETNAQSGIAIARRQVAGSATQILSTDRFDDAVDMVAIKMLGLVQRVYDKQTTVYITDDEGRVKQSGFMATKKDADGNTVPAVDIRAGQYDVSIETAPDVSSQNEEARMLLIQLMEAGYTPDKWEPMVLDLMRIPLSAKLRKDFEERAAQQQQAMASQQAAKAPNGISDDMGSALVGGGPNPSFSQ